MSNTVKLIVEIPEKTIAHIRSDYGHSYKGLYDEDRDKIVDAIYHGILLDDVKDIIRDKKAAETDVAREYYNLGLGDAINILDYVGKAESEVK